MNYGAGWGTQRDTAVINAGVISYARMLEETNQRGWSVDVQHKD